MDFQIGDKVVYCRRNGYREPTIITRIDGDLLTVDTYCFDGSVVVHAGNSQQAGSRDWIEK